jgi:hypothetical protein
MPAPLDFDRAVLVISFLDTLCQALKDKLKGKSVCEEMDRPKTEAYGRIKRFETPGTVVEIMDAKTRRVKYRVNRDEAGDVHEIPMV